MLISCFCSFVNIHNLLNVWTLYVLTGDKLGSGKLLLLLKQVGKKVWFSVQQKLTPSVQIQEQKHW